jgi:hypothetical protein
VDAAAVVIFLQTLCALGALCGSKRAFIRVNPVSERKIFLYGQAIFGYNMYLTKVRRQRTDDRRRKTVLGTPYGEYGTQDGRQTTDDGGQLVQRES